MQWVIDYKIRQSSISISTELCSKSAPKYKTYQAGFDYSKACKINALAIDSCHFNWATFCLPLARSLCRLSEEFASKKGRHS